MDDETKEDQTSLELEGEAAQETVEKKRLAKMQGTYALPASDPEKLSKILKAYVIASKQGAEAVKYTDVGAVAAIHPTEVSRNNTFLSEGGFIIAERYGYYRPSPEVTNYAKQAPWDEESAKAHIRSLIEKTWFGETVRQQFQLQSALNRSQLIRAFGIKATPDPSDANRLGLLVDFLVYFEYLLTDEQGNFIARSGGEQISQASHSADAFVVDETPLTERIQPLLPQSPSERPSIEVSCRVNVNLNLTPGTTDEELQSLVKKVKATIAMLQERVD
ncbi:MAG: hypothetical protein ABSH52_25805 [Terriglobia bacterium]|jgi:hypothetical protein